MLSIQALRGAGWLVLSRFLGRFVDFFTLLILARLLTPADFGLTTLALTLIVVLDAVLEIPVTQALLRLRSFDKSHLDTGFTLGLMRGAMIGAVTLAAAWPFAAFYDDSRLIPLMAVLSLGPIARGLASPGMIVYIRAMSFRQTFTAEILGKICAFALAITLVHLGAGYWAIVANTVTAAVATSLATHFIAPYRPKISFARFKDFAGFTGWFSSAQIVGALNWQFDRILLGRFVDRPTLGRFAIASDLSVMPTQSLIGPAMQPVMAAFATINDQPDRMRTAFLKAARFAMFAALPTGVGIALTADLIVALLLGPGWEEAGPLLSLLVLAVLPGAYFQTLSSLCVAMNRPSVLFRVCVFELGLRIPLVCIGLFLSGVDGVVWARVAISMAMLGIYMLYARLLVGLGFRRQIINLWKLALATGLMAVAVALLRPALDDLGLPVILELLLAAATGLAIYGAALFVLGVRLELGRGRFALTDRWARPQA
ncbi:lipopolysaccharide biosynthesis protein [Paenirhodobacter populi]|uniref:Lipopolysaccharide biosynthesis protein n=1 Tax=Paenirhodobacter populi TaxID=2306993 RepID=A0A443JKP6_9RHOB|nr:lipopolysaccharide biosynthesis protein [Sinirhodobacter populi]RWR11073.1 lipopolysaccharide biosynthesis protein [Sinirhodobacter populi]RWR21169.1 lipopolysaccharide biosynthesis protein [Sinirhodobacter populi]RWR35045.1 lipopolysaccharide biosynthesis protein [Sinirhodobacter populi]